LTNLTLDIAEKHQKTLIFVICKLVNKGIWLFSLTETSYPKESSLQKTALQGMSDNWNENIINSQKAGHNP
jgi:hypothetical protein